MGYDKRMKRIEIGCACALLLFAGCSQKEETPAKTVSEVKGKPIAAAVPTNAPAPAASVSTPVLTAPTQVVAVAAAPAPAASLTVSTNVSPAIVNGYVQVGFDSLSAFHYIMPDDVTPTNQPPADQFPPAVKALNEKAIALKGFMLPLRVDQGLVTEMLLMKDQSMCCYGTSPKINEWVSVKMSEKGVKPVMDQPVTLFGKFKVGEMRENGYLVGIYQMDGEKMEWQ